MKEPTKYKPDTPHLSIDANGQPIVIGDDEPDKDHLNDEGRVIGDCTLQLEERIARLERIVKQGFDSKTPTISEEVEKL